MKIAWNKVLVLPDKDHDEQQGFAIATEIDSQFHWSIRGTVTVVPDRLIFFEPAKVMTGFNKRTSQFNYHRSLEIGSEMEVQPGDRVLFDFTVKYDPIYIDGAILMPYDKLIALENPIRPLNGWLLVEMMERDKLEEVLPGVYMEHTDANKYGYAKVKYAGGCAKYSDGRWVEDEGIGPDAIITYDKRRAMRLELDRHNTLTQRQSSLFKIHRKDVLLWTSPQ